VVLWRKGSFGTQSEEGSRFVERMLTTVATLRLQGQKRFRLPGGSKRGASSRSPGGFL
jgi:hypothetical protein